MKVFHHSNCRGKDLMSGVKPTKMINWPCRRTPTSWYGTSPTSTTVGMYVLLLYLCRYLTCYCINHRPQASALSEETRGRHLTPWELFCCMVSARGSCVQPTSRGPGLLLMTQYVGSRLCLARLLLSCSFSSSLVSLQQQSHTISVMPGPVELELRLV